MHDSSIRETQYLDVREHVSRESLLADLSGVLTLPLTYRPPGTHSDARNVTAINTRPRRSGKHNDILQRLLSCQQLLAKPFNDSITGPCRCDSLYRPYAI